MPKEDEKLAAILAEMRAAAKSTDLFNGEEVGEPLIRGTKVEEWADRIDAAAKRKRDAHTNDIHDALYMATGIPGNAAALREALEEIYNEAQNICDYCDEQRIVSHRADKIERIVNTALAAPARNADRFDNYLDARAEYDGNLGSEEWRFGAWLFATAKGGAKCVNGLRGEPDCRGCNEHCEDVRKRNCFYWNPDIEGGVCALTGKKSCPISCDNFHIPEKVSPPPAEGGAE